MKNLKAPRKILLLARPGSSVDRNMQKLLPFLEVHLLFRVVICRVETS